jgi:fatty-acid desaturase
MRNGNLSGKWDRYPVAMDMFSFAASVLYNFAFLHARIIKIIIIIIIPYLYSTLFIHLYAQRCFTVYKINKTLQYIKQIKH